MKQIMQLIQEEKTSQMKMIPSAALNWPQSHHHGGGRSTLHPEA